MCGIAGVFGGDQCDFDAVAEMVTCIHHRGPDGSGLFRTRSGSIGGARLSLLDMAGGAQPFLSADGTTGLVYNGEIYNHVAIRANLESEGAYFRTRSDTEVLFNLLVHRGPDGLKDLDGMFAFATLTEDTLFLARDRIGIKPLYYWLDPSGRRIAFASEAKAILALSFVQPRLDPRAFFEVLTFGHVLGDSSMFAGIKQLLPGHYISCRLEGEGLKLGGGRWLPADDPEEEDISDEDVTNRAFESFVGSVEAQLQADHEVGLLLSGGLDSTLIAGAARTILGRKLHTFSIADDPLSADLTSARRVADTLICPHVETIVQPHEYLASLPGILYTAESPRIAPLVGMVCRVARREVKAVLCGEGADELFAGYWGHEDPNDYLRALLRRYLRAKDAAGALGTSLSETSKPVLRRFCEERDNLQHLVYDFLSRDALVNDHLNPMDQNSMAASLELRVPYLSNGLSSLAQSLPLARKIKPGRRKIVLRELAPRLLPKDLADQIAARRKMAFPQASQQLRSVIEAELAAALAAALPGTYFEAHPLRPYFGSLFDVMLFDLFALIFFGGQSKDEDLGRRYLSGDRALLEVTRRTVGDVAAPMLPGATVPVG